MIQGKTVLAIIPARGGSKGIPRKNIVPLAGKPLIAWSIEAAKKSKYIDRLILSSEDEEIINIASEWGCDIPFVRPVELAQDETPMVEPILHALDTLKDNFFYIVLLQPTSPLRNVTDIDDCIELCHKNQAPACVSITEADKSPYWMYQLDETGHLLPLLKSETQHSRRQDIPQVYILNGAIYVAEADFIRRHRSFITDETVTYLMPRERSLDLDTDLDLKICEILLSNK